MRTLLSIVAPQVVIKTTSGANLDNKIDIMAIYAFRCLDPNLAPDTDQGIFIQ